MARIVGVHGVGNYRGGYQHEEVAAALGKSWTRRLADGFGVPAQRVDLRVAYYAPALHRSVRQGVGDLIALDVHAQAMVLDWVAALGAPSDIVQGRLTQPVRQAVEWAARHLGVPYERLARLFVAAFFPEVSTYLNDADARVRARHTIADAIAEHRPRVVIAHSLGSVVTYEALWARPLAVPLLVTIGSPLGLPGVVFERLEPVPAPRAARPPGVQRWVNIADHGDFIAVPKRLSDRCDVDEEYGVSIHPVDFHRVASYLGCSRLAMILAPYLDGVGSTA
jgi:hypothetical protein